MLYQTAYYGHACANSGGVLLLQQLKGKRGKKPVLFACLCDAESNSGASAYFATHIIDWFRYEGLPLCGNGKTKEMEQLQKKLEKKLEQILADIFMIYPEQKMHFNGMICVGDALCFFYQGKQRICLLNKLFERDHIKRLNAPDQPEERMVFQQARIQAGAGLLLGTESFFEAFGREELEECLEIQVMDREERMQKRLQELGKETIRRGQSSVAVIWIGFWEGRG